MAKTKRSKSGERTSDAIAEQLKQLKRIQAAVTDVTRRDARSKLLAAMRRTRVALDAEHPVARKKPKRTGPLSVESKRRRWVNEGRVCLRGSTHVLVVACLSAGISVRVDPNTLHRWIPGWVRTVWVDGKLQTVAELRRLHRSPKARKLAVADALLRSQV